MAPGIFKRTANEFSYWMHSTWTLQQVGDFWDGVAEEYDAINSKTVSYFRRFTDTFKLVDLPDKARLLDICSRSGNGTNFFYGHGKVESAVCADVSVKLGEICQRRLDASGFHNYQWIQMKDYALPFRDGEFDVVLCLETVEHLAEPEKLVKELSRVIKPNGTMVLTTPNVLWEPVHAFAAVTKLHHSEGPHHFIRYRRLVNMIKDAGFEIQVAQTTVLLPAGPAWMVRMSDWFEDRLRTTLMPLIGLRRIFVCKMPEK
ncbi:MAG: methyltransferase domain-containing protein [Chloroflexi bacterium]|nr:methyltransferase domain-containing protein [Chloroflexota bacterium]